MPCGGWTDSARRDHQRAQPRIPGAVAPVRLSPFGSGRSVGNQLRPDRVKCRTSAAVAHYPGLAKHETQTAGAWSIGAARRWGQVLPNHPTQVVNTSARNMWKGGVSGSDGRRNENMPLTPLEAQKRVCIWVHQLPPVCRSVCLSVCLSDGDAWWPCACQPLPARASPTHDPFPAVS
jgi:hypothetical protein